MPLRAGFLRLVYVCLGVLLTTSSVWASDDIGQYESLYKECSAWSNAACVRKNQGKMNHLFFQGKLWPNEKASLGLALFNEAKLNATADYQSRVEYNLLKYQAAAKVLASYSNRKEMAEEMVQYFSGANPELFQADKQFADEKVKEYSKAEKKSKGNNGPGWGTAVLGGIAAGLSGQPYVPPAAQLPATDTSTNYNATTQTESPRTNNGGSYVLPCQDLTHLVSASWVSDKYTRGEQHLWLQNNSGTALECAWREPFASAVVRGADYWSPYQKKATSASVTPGQANGQIRYSCIAQSQSQDAVEDRCRWQFPRE